MTTKQLTDKIVQSPELKAKVEELVKQYDKPQGRWKPEKGNFYYEIESNVEILSCRWENDEIDNDLYAIGNCYRTSELAQKAIDRQLLLQELKDYALEVNGDWEYDRGDDEFVYYIGLNDDDRLEVSNDNARPSTVLFKKHNFALYAIVKFGDRLKILFEKEAWG